MTRIQTRLAAVAVLLGGAAAAHAGPPASAAEAARVARVAETARTAETARVAETAKAAEARKAAPKPVADASRPIESKHYSAWATADVNVLPDGKKPLASRASHNREANRSLYEQLKRDDRYRATLEARSPGITERLEPGPRGGMTSRSPDKTLTWHHHPESANGTMRMELVPRSHHESAGAVQKSLHPEQKGGYAGLQPKPGSPAKK